MRLLVTRMVIGGVAAAAIGAGLVARWQTGKAVGLHRERVLELCVDALARIPDPPTPDALRRDMAERWQWGSYDFPSRLFADRLPHETDRFAAIRVSRHERLPGPERRCRRSMCVYSIPLDRVAAAATEDRCGGGGATEMVTPTLKPDILKAR